MSQSVSNRSNGIIYGNKMQGRITILNQDSKPYDGKVRLWLFKLASDNMFYGAASIYVPMHIEAGKTAQASFFFDNLHYCRPLQ